MSKKLTPAQQQYADLKSQYADCILLFRLGDFYEMFYDDATIGHKVLALTLTAKNKSSDNPIPMAGIPYHALDKYLPKLIAAGYKVAIAEQVGKVVPGTVVDREVLKVITPGNYIQENGDTIITVSIWYGGSLSDVYHCAWGDFTLGQFYTKSFPSFEKISQHLQLLHPREIILHVELPEKSQFEIFGNDLGVMVTVHDHPFDILHHLKTVTGTSSLDGFGYAVKDGRERALSTLFSYFEHNQKQSLHGIDSITFQSQEGIVQLDPITVRNLELFQSSYEGTEKHSLFGVVNKTSSALGKRLLKEWILHPINDLGQIAYRQSLLRKYSDNKKIQKHLHAIISKIPDIPRTVRRILFGKKSPLVIQGLRNTLESLTSDDLLIDELTSVGIAGKHIESILDLSSHLKGAINPGLIDDQYGFIAHGYDAQVDKLRQIVDGSDELLLSYQQFLIDETGIKTLKLKYISNQGYLLEATKKESPILQGFESHGNEKLTFIQSQSLKGCDRFVTPYLQHIQQDVLDSRDSLHVREYQILDQIIEDINDKISALDDFCDSLGFLDIAVSLSSLLSDQRWSLPLFSDDDKSITIIDGFHPVVDAFLPRDQEFIPNNLMMSSSSFFHCITGPNMGGKSTYLRQNAIILLLAHCGLPVPAKSTTIPCIDGLYARVGSGDALAKNQSTFMTEMIEVANILGSATDRSFIVLDELGRGTSTSDGLALAKAISVYICQHLKTPSLFATHYHELIDLEGLVKGFDNYSVGIYESSDNVVFLKKIVHGGASKSYGLDVAKLAGVPQSIIESAKIYLSELPNFDLITNDSNDGSTNNKHSKPYQAGFGFGEIDDQNKRLVDFIKDQFSQFDSNQITPIEALVKIQQLETYIKNSK